MTEATSPTPPGDARRVLVLTHTGRDDAREVALDVVRALTGHGIIVRLLEPEASDLGLDPGSLAGAVAGSVEVHAAPDADARGDASVGCELAIVIGGDGTILRAAEITHVSGTPILGVNLGHVGFLAEAEYEDVDTVIDSVVHRRYTSEDRMTLDVVVYRDGEIVNRTFAVNEASVEKAARERMLEVVVEVEPVDE